MSDSKRIKGEIYMIIQIGRVYRNERYKRIVKRRKIPDKEI